jgi:hypothetical protein
MVSLATNGEADPYAIDRYIVTTVYIYMHCYSLAPSLLLLSVVPRITASLLLQVGSGVFAFTCCCVLLVASTVTAIRANMHTVTAFSIQSS